MKLRKFMALGLVAAMTATMFAGCGSKDSTTSDAHRAQTTLRAQRQTAL